MKQFIHWKYLEYNIICTGLPAIHLEIYIQSIFQPKHVSSWEGYKEKASACKAIPTGPFEITLAGFC